MKLIPYGNHLASIFVTIFLLWPAPMNAQCPGSCSPTYDFSWPRGGFQEVFLVTITLPGVWNGRSVRKLDRGDWTGLTSDLIRWCA
jgi:hypothetical protein